MKINSISFKLFISTVLVCLLFLNIILGIQILLTDSVFKHSQKNIFEKNVNDIASVYLSDASNFLEYSKNKATNDNFEILFLDSDFKNIEELNYVSNKNEVFLKGSKWVISQLKGKIIDKTQHITYFDNDSFTSNVFVIKPLPIKDHTPVYLLAMDNIKLTKNITYTIQYFYLIIFFVMVLLIFIIAYIYSKFISKPLISMNLIAKKMAALDFSQSLNIKSDDEIGSLAQSLNTLSKELNFNINQLEESNKKLTLFTSNASHELKTPLSIISGYVEGIRDGIYKDKQDKYLDLILKEVDRTNALVCDMLTILKYENKNDLSKDKTFSLDSLLLDTIKRFDNSFRNKNISFENNVPTSVLEVFGDKEKITHVLENLFSNALRYTDSRGIVILNIDTLESSVVVSLENSCESIDEKEINKLWDRFYRLEKSRNKYLGGSGLGLSIVHSILSNEGSDFGVCTTPLGIKFYFSLNLKKSPKY